MAPPTPFLFGKVPDRGDFVRAGPISPLLDALDAWLQRGLVVHRRPIEGAPAVGFMLGRGSSVLLGAFGPSRDRAGRAFPMVAGATLEGEGVSAEGALLRAQAPLLRTAVACTGELARGEVTLDEALARLQEVEPSKAGEGGGRATTEVLGAVPAVALVERVAGVLHPLREGGATPRYGLGFPLPQPPEARPTAAAFWLDAAVRACGRLAEVSLFWTAEGERARAALFLGSPTPDALAYLLAGVPAEGVYDLDHDLGDPDGEPPADEAALPLNALLDRL